ncbi:MAG TPA: peroxidase family protein, partial [Thermomicrobiales bacterium]|nr:peroxidase family protein [Thermomicrobiales bacterium]
RGPAAPAPGAIRPVAEQGTGPGLGWSERFLDGSQEAEQRLFERFAEEIKQVQAQIRDREMAPQIRRAFHAKMHAGVTNAELRIRPDLAEDLRSGLFQPGAIYPATVRLSNASAAIEPDSERDLRGIAVRVRVGEDQNQDFLMTNAAASHARDARQFMVAAKASASKSRLGTILGLVRGLGPIEAVRMLLVIARSARKVDSLVTEQYSSRAAFTIGPYAVKLRLQPVSSPQRVSDGPDGASGGDFLREDLVARLKRSDVVWDLQIQRYRDEHRTPIEDGTVLWDEKVSPAETMGQLVIPRQDLTTAEARGRAEDVDRLEFNPWNALPEHRPLGSLNRARRIVYPASGAFRIGRASETTPAEGIVKRAYWLVLVRGFNHVNRVVPWHKLPPLVGTFNLAAYRRVLRQENLHDTSLQAPDAPVDVPRFEPRFLVSRTSDGSYNDLERPEMGSAMTRFGRNVPLSDAYPEPEPALLRPSPRDVSERLLKREEFVPATSLNLLAAAWIQFQVHDWFDHKVEEQPGHEFEIPVTPGDPWGEPVMRIRRTAADPTRTPDEAALPPTYINQNSHWWDASQIYGSDQETTDSLRSHEDGKLTVDESGFLPTLDGTSITGFSNNWWVGLALLHNLFTREHNAICDMLRREHPCWPDEQLFDVARLINTALMAKIHTVEWTPAILGHPTLSIGMNANWYGLQTAGLQRAFGRLTRNEAISGIPGSPMSHDGVPFSLTEEFVAVYRMHPLIPDDISFHCVVDGSHIKTLAFADTAFNKAGAVFDDVTFEDAFYSFGIAHPGAITLHNYPEFLRNLHVPEDAPAAGRPLDVAAIDILRDRERVVPRYNRFRELLKRGRVRSFDEITPNPKWARELREVYEGDVDRVDTMVGMFAEPVPAGFGFSDTATRIFIPMASRRLKSDRFFTSDWKPEIYTNEGMEWINRNGMTSVLLRHNRSLAPALSDAANPFAPWKRVDRY